MPKDALALSIKEARPIMHEIDFTYILIPQIYKCFVFYFFSSTFYHYFLLSGKLRYLKYKWSLLK